LIHSAQDPPLRWSSHTLLEHPFEPVDVEHVNVEGDGANVGDARRTIAPHEPEQRVDAPHPRPRQRAVEERRGVLVDDRTASLHPAAERVDIPHGADTPLDRVIARADSSASSVGPEIRGDCHVPGTLNEILKPVIVAADGVSARHRHDHRPFAHAAQVLENIAGRESRS
jgi:hypothetical protein